MHDRANCWGIASCSHSNSGFLHSWLLHASVRSHGSSFIHHTHSSIEQTGLLLRSTSQCLCLCFFLLVFFFFLPSSSSSSADLNSLQGSTVAVTIDFVLLSAEIFSMAPTVDFLRSDHLNDGCLIKLHRRTFSPAFIEVC